MLIGILSDTHDNLPKVKAALDIFKENAVNLIFHAGDIVSPFTARLINENIPADLPIYLVFGNNDGEKEGLRQVFPQITNPPFVVNIEHKLYVLAHSKDQISMEITEKADVIITGHTHKAEIIKDEDGKLWVNPGEACGWLTGKSSLVILNTEDMRPKLIEF